MLHLDYCVIGGGIVGLAVAAALAPFGSVAVIEKHPRLLQETSSRNSGVVHSGLYYPADSLKTKLCMEGNANIWRLQNKFPEAIQARRIGKWIGSCDASEDAKLQELMAKMAERRIPYEMVSAERARHEEPIVRMHTIVNATSTGIVDVHTLADFYSRLVENSGEGYVLCGSEVTRIDLPEAAPPRTGTQASIHLTVGSSSTPHSNTADEPYCISVGKAVICAAGLHANTLWGRLFCGNHAVRQPQSHRLYACKGRYAGYRGRAPVSRLVYPCPLPNLVGLGVHSVVDVAGQVRFGPDALYQDSFDDIAIANSETEETAFLDSQYAAVSRYVPGIERERFFADFAGIRPKLARAGEGFRDFLLEYVDAVTEPSPAVVAAKGGHAEESVLCPIMKAVTHHSEGERKDQATLVWLNGIESPGLTASSAIADHVAAWLVGARKYKTHPPPWSS